MTLDLVVRAQRGDHEAFEALARASVDRLYAIARRVLRDPDLAEDAVQECLVRTWRDLRALQAPERFDAWQYRLLLHACRDEQRRARRRPTVVEIGRLDPGGNDAALATVERRDELERGFNRLSVDHRMALVLHHYAGLRSSEIAVALGVPEGTVVSRIHYAIQAMRTVLAPADVRAASSEETLAT
jgi:RNA polymerase sigma-70 factor, ECF subfamily